MHILRAPESIAAPAPSSTRAGDLVGEVALGPADLLAKRKRSVVTVGERELLVIFHRRRFTVVENRCPHRGADLQDAIIAGRTLTCTWHFFKYSLTDGALKSAPRRECGQDRRLTLFSTRVVDGWLNATVRPESAR